LKFLVCTDGAEQADRAVRLAAELARACAADVTVLGIQETSGASEAILNALRRSQQLFEAQKIAVEIISKSGDPIDEIVKRTTETPYDLVIIGAVRKGRQGPFSMSSKAYKIVKLIGPPVLVVMGTPATLRRMLICSGGKGYIESAFDLATRIGQKTGASISLLHVMPEPPAIYSEIRKREQDLELVLNSNSELGRNLRHEKEILAAQGIQAEIVLRQGFVLEEIFREIADGHYDLIVAGSSLSTGPLRTYVLGDVTREIVNRADCPVLIARHTTKPPGLKHRLRQFLHSFSMTAGPETRSSKVGSDPPVSTST